MKLQAVIRGWMYRKKVKKGLANVKVKDTDLDEIDQFNVEEMLDFNEDQFESDLIMNDEHMSKMIETFGQMASM